MVRFLSPAPLPPTLFPPSFQPYPELVPGGIFQQDESPRVNGVSWEVYLWQEYEVGMWRGLCLRQVLFLFKFTKIGFRFAFGG